jgi:hypothetical protein
MPKNNNHLAALVGWEEDVIYLALDTSLFWDQYCLVRLCVVYRGRALPVVWRVMEHKSASVAFEDYHQMLRCAVNRLPTGKKVILLADRGFVHTQLMQLLTTELGWSYRIRVKGNTWVWRGKSGWCQLQDVHCHRGEAVCLHNVRIHKGQWYGIVHIIVGRNNVNGEFWGIISDEPTTLHTFAEYALRFDIEENFAESFRSGFPTMEKTQAKDDQSNGWNMQRSEIRSVVALSRLWFILALATLYVTAQGDDVVASGQRRRIDTHWFRGNSYFRIGWEWVKAASLKGWQVISSVCFLTHRDLNPSMASSKQDEQRRFRFEFQIQTFIYTPD